MRLIDADALMEKQYAKLRDGEVLYRIPPEAIDNAPTVDAVPVVRCKDCKHFTEGMAVGMCYRIPGKPILPITYDHFCSYGEMRKEKK